METSTWPGCARDKPHADVASMAHLFPVTCRALRQELGLAISTGGSARVLPDLVHHSASPSIDVVGAA